MAKAKVIIDTSAFDKQMVDEYKKNTPVAGGNARRNTKRVGNSVVGDYAYAGVLDDGLFPNPPKAGTGKTQGGYSTQAKRGMATPTLEYVAEQLQAFVKRSNT